MKALPGGSVVKNLPANAGDMGSVGLGRIPGEGNDNLLKYSCREIPQTEEPGRLQAMVSPKSLT